MLQGALDSSLTRKSGTHEKINSSLFPLSSDISLHEAMGKHHLLRAVTTTAITQSPVDIFFKPVLFELGVTSLSHDCPIFCELAKNSWQQIGTFCPIRIATLPSDFIVRSQSD